MSQGVVVLCLPSCDGAPDAFVVKSGCESVAWATQTRRGSCTVPMLRSASRARG